MEKKYQINTNIEACYVLKNGAIFMKKFSFCRKHSTLKRFKTAKKTICFKNFEDTVFYDCEERFSEC